MTQHLRIARPVSDLAKSEALYGQGLGLSVLARFEDHDGFSGVMLGEPDGAYHLELTVCLSHPVRPSPTPEDLLVHYLPDASEWRLACSRMLSAGFKPVAAFNPYWDERGRTFEDHDGYRLVLQNAAWEYTVAS